jgi:hypothetical protein
MTMAERELSAFFNTVTQLFGLEQAELSAEDWLQELSEIDGSAHFNPRVAIGHREGFDSARKSSERFVLIQLNSQIA